MPRFRMDNIETDIRERERYQRWLEKKAKGQSPQMQILQRRTIASANAVRNLLRDIDFVLLSSSLYFFCEDIEAKAFARQYEAQLELACIDPDKFTKGLHSFYSKMAKDIDKNGKFQMFAEFLSECICRYDEKSRGNGARSSANVMDSYMNLLLQQLDYLRPSGVSLDKVVCGRAAGTGEILLIDDPFPYSDCASEEAVAELSKHGRATTEEVLRRCFGKYGIQVSNLMEAARLSEVDNMSSTQRCALLPYINEYTYDIVGDPKQPFDGVVVFKGELRFSEEYTTETLQAMLKKRVRTLPTNGLRLEFSYSPEKPYHFFDILMKEVCYGESIIMLFKFHTDMGDMTGFYNTKSGAFFSPLHVGSRGIGDLPEQFMRMVLYLYACGVTRDGDKMRRCIHEHIWFKIAPGRLGVINNYTVSAHGVGGRLLDTYHKSKGTTNPTGPRAGNEKYEAEIRTIQGFIRKVGTGKTPSEEAVARAQALGFDLAPDETYVQPFMRNTWKLRRRREGEGANGTS